jgi:hypothetical protein
LALSVECDEHARNAVATLEQLLGPATAIVRSGGAWTDPETGQVEDKLHIHFRITGSARGPEALTKLKRARELATAIVCGDSTNVPIVHCINGKAPTTQDGRNSAFEALNRRRDRPRQRFPRARSSAPGSRPGPAGPRSGYPRRRLGQLIKSAGRRSVPGPLVRASPSVAQKWDEYRRGHQHCAG